MPKNFALTQPLVELIIDIVRPLRARERVVIGEIVVSLSNLTLLANKVTFRQQSLFSRCRNMRMGVSAVLLCGGMVGFTGCATRAFNQNEESGIRQAPVTPGLGQGTGFAYGQEDLDPTFSRYKAKKVESEED